MLPRLWQAFSERTNSGSSRSRTYVSDRSRGTNGSAAHGGGGKWGSQGSGDDGKWGSHGAGGWGVNGEGGKWGSQGRGDGGKPTNNWVPLQQQADNYREKAKLRDEEALSEAVAGRQM